MNGKICVVTGANSGIGKSTALQLSQLGAQVVMICRDLQRGTEAREEIEQQTGNHNLDLLIADLSSQDSIRHVAAELLAKYQHLHVLINNAGLAVRSRTLSRDQIEITFAVNHLAYFLLTNLLLERLKASAPSRIIVVSSEAHRNAHIDFENLQSEKGFSGFGAYSITKLCNVLFTHELARKLEGTGVTANVLHPGFLNTGIFRAAPGWMRFLVRITAGSADKGAKAIVHLATAPELERVSGKYFRGMKETPSSTESQDPALAERLWKISATMTGF